MKLVDPTVKSAAHNCVSAPRLDSLEGKTIGLLTNGKVNADVLLHETAELFRTRHQCRVLDMSSKQNASAPAPGGIIKDLALECDFLITAMGD